MTPEQVTRYSRNILLEGIGRKGQQSLLSSHVTVIGAGGLGSPVLQYLAAAGVGNIRIIESDRLDMTNLQRQVLYSEKDVGQFKADLALSRLQQLNSSIRIETVHERFSVANYEKCLKNTDLVVEGSDNFATKFLANDACYFLKIPLITGGIVRYTGHCMFLNAQKTDSPCYRCVFDRIPPADSVPSCSSAGVLGSLAGLIGSTMVSMALMYLVEKPAESGRLVSADLSDFQLRTISIAKNQECRLCAEKADIKNIKEEKQTLQPYQEFSLSPERAF